MSLAHIYSDNKVRVQGCSYLLVPRSKRPVLAILKATWKHVFVTSGEPGPRSLTGTFSGCFKNVPLRLLGTRFKQEIALVNLAPGALLGHLFEMPCRLEFTLTRVIKCHWCLLDLELNQIKVATPHWDICNYRFTPQLHMNSQYFFKIVT
jgi:hypothetical protein